MSNITSADLIRYNANPRHTDTGDCTKRALSLAFDMPYSQVSKELNGISRTMLGTRYNSLSVVTKFLRNHNAQKLEGLQGKTIEELADSTNDTLIVHCSKDTGSARSTHLVTIIDGKVYDTWDSRYWKAISVWTPPESRHIENPSTFDEEDFEQLEKAGYEAVSATADAYTKKLQSKGINLALISVKCDHADYTDAFSVEVTLQIEATYADGSAEQYRYEYPLAYHPADTFEQAVQKIKAQGKQKTYDRIYNLAVQYKKTNAGVEKYKNRGGTSYSQAVHNASRYMNFYEKQVFNQLPPELKPYVTYIDQMGPTRDWSTTIVFKIPDPTTGELVKKEVYGFWDETVQDDLQELADLLN